MVITFYTLQKVLYEGFLLLMFGGNEDHYDTVYALYPSPGTPGYDHGLLLSVSWKCAEGDTAVCLSSLGFSILRLRKIERIGGLYMSLFK